MWILYVLFFKYKVKRRKMNFKEFVKAMSLNESKKTEYTYDVDLTADSTGLTVEGIFGPKEREGEFFRDEERYWFNIDLYFDFVAADDGDVGNKWVEIDPDKCKIEGISFLHDRPTSLSDDEKKEWAELENRSKAFNEKFKNPKDIVKELFNDINKQFTDNYEKIMDAAKKDHDDRIASDNWYDRD